LAQGRWLLTLRQEADPEQRGGRSGSPGRGDRDATSEPLIARKRQRRLTGVDQMVLALYGKGLTTGEISAHFAEIYDASVFTETISRITDKVIEEMGDRQNRPLDAVYGARPTSVRPH
jgi:transposase-like protein